MAVFILDTILIFINLNIDREITFFLGLIIAANGNALYFNFSVREIQKIKTKQLSSDDYETALRNRGGGSWLGVGFAILITLGYVALTTLVMVAVQLVFQIRY